MNIDIPRSRVRNVTRMSLRAYTMNSTKPSGFPAGMVGVWFAH